MTYSDEPVSGWLATRLARAPAWLFVAYAISASFGTYFCMYAFRKPFAAATFEGQLFLGSFLELKSALIISQIVGYASSKYIGIKVCSELHPRHHGVALLLLISWAGLALVLFALVSADWKAAAIFLNGLPLGLVWGLVVRRLEGRRSSEILLAGLSCSFIVSSGIVKDVGRAMMSGGVAEWWAGVPLLGPPLAHSLGRVSEEWMPALTGLHFLPLFLLFVWMLGQLPGPSSADIAARRRRVEMDRALRGSFVRDFLPGIVLLAIAYFLLTAYRDFRDNFAVEILTDLGYPYAGNEAIITRVETIVALGVMGLLALLGSVRSNRLGLIAAFAMMGSGTALLAVASLLLELGWIEGFGWMVLVGLGSYMAYVPYGSVLFDRMFASTGAIGTAVFAIYLADAIGYTGSVGVMVYKDLAVAEVSRLGFFKAFTWLMALVGCVCLLFACLYFDRLARRTRVSEEGARA